MNTFKNILKNIFAFIIITPFSLIYFVFLDVIYLTLGLALITLKFFAYVFSCGSFKLNLDDDYLDKAL
jgi:hypothetical protein